MAAAAGAAQRAAAADEERGMVRITAGEPDWANHLEKKCCDSFSSSPAMKLTKV
jgi:hypothetical protein